MGLQDLTGFEEGKFTQTDEVIERVAKEVRAASLEKRTPIWSALSDYLWTLAQEQDRKIIDAESRKRTASQVIESGYVNSCNDVGHVFISVARELGIPTLYVETLRSWETRKNGTSIVGHIFADVFLGGKWRAYEPKAGFCPQNQYWLRQIGECAVVGKGIDSSHVYLLENGVYRPNPESLTNLRKNSRVAKLWTGWNSEKET